ncbi:GNAT family N-acetyltransferase [Agrobacterium larrymoorei]|uniref:Acetyltransferase n=1 Tax=Agrobacterium larrymoorei TaxID=160699 RepID=A0A4D7DXW1_9HYPH|nr:GNAT family N-acetyltransferase [Agrobacterium larrymoorei]QCI99639.1 acetyltransferase [Agrobacterium larrymoorei]QYA09931.1 acetyltransferase [Agrobacterium larrymoorei]
MDHSGDKRRSSVQQGVQVPQEDAASLVYQAFHLDCRGTVEVRRQGPSLFATDMDGKKAEFRLVGAPAHPGIEIVLTSDSEDRSRLASAVFEYLFSSKPSPSSLELSGAGWSKVSAQLAEDGVAFTHENASGRLLLFADMFWQTSKLWTQPNKCIFPRRETFDGKVSHPLRPRKPQGTVYARYIPWLHGVLSLDAATFDDLPNIHRWMNDPRVNEFWNEAGDMEKHRQYLDIMFADPHILPLIGRFNGKAFSYFEIYWAKEDVVGTFCDAANYDRGCHVIVGEEEYRGQRWFTAWLPSLIHYAFLDDPRTEHLLQEPSVLHHRQLRNLQRSGFSHLKSVDLPTKRAAIMSISRDRFFSDKLWQPDVDLSVF